MIGPEMIYLQWHGDSDPVELGEPDGTGVTWSIFREYSRDIHYVRGDLHDAVVAELAMLRQRVDRFHDLVVIQTGDGNWNYDHYMHGMANGMLLAEAVIGDVDYKPLSAPPEWLSDRDRPLPLLPQDENAR